HDAELVDQLFFELARCGGIGLGLTLLALTRIGGGRRYALSVQRSSRQEIRRGDSVPFRQTGHDYFPLFGGEFAVLKIACDAAQVSHALEFIDQGEVMRASHTERLQMI